MLHLGEQVAEVLGVQALAGRRRGAGATSGTVSVASSTTRPRSASDGPPQRRRVDGDAGRDQRRVDAASNSSST